MPEPPDQRSCLRHCLHPTKDTRLCKAKRLMINMDQDQPYSKEKVWSNIMGTKLYLIIREMKASFIVKQLLATFDSMHGIGINLKLNCSKSVRLSEFEK